MEKDFSELEEILPESSTRLVSLNTRVPQNVSKMVDESVGILQTTSRYLKVSKQVAIQILIERGYEAIRAEFESQDFVKSEVAASIEDTGEKVVSMERAPRSKSSFDIQAYHEMGNKSSYEPRIQQTNSASSESQERLQTKLGLRG